MLTPNDLVLLREALAYWSTHAVGLELADKASTELADVDASEEDIVALYKRLMPDNVRYIVVDGDTNHVVNTRLFRKVPEIQPASDRWQVRTVIG